MSSVNVELHTFQSPKFRSVVAEAIGFFESTPVHHLPPPSRFTGCGAYALYYLDSYGLYAKITQLNQEGATRGCANICYNRIIGR